MNIRIHTSLMTKVAHLGLRPFGQSLNAALKSLREKKTHWVIYSLSLIFLITFVNPKVCVAPLRSAVSMSTASNNGTDVIRMEAEIRRAFIRFQMPVDLFLVHEIALVGTGSQVDPRLIAAIVIAESSGNPFAISNQNAIGLMQINAKVWARKLDFSRNNPFDPAVNLRMGVPILAGCLKDYRWLDSALAAYLGDPTFAHDETMVYVNRVIRIYEKMGHLKVQRNPAWRAVALNTPVAAVDKI